MKGACWEPQNHPTSWGLLLPLGHAADRLCSTAGRIRQSRRLQRFSPEAGLS